MAKVPMRNMTGRPLQSRGSVRIFHIALLGAAGILAAAASVYLFVCPCGNVPGGYLLGRQVAGPVPDWSFANDVPLCQVQVRGWLPHSVNLNCMASQGRLYLSTGTYRDKVWIRAALADPRARVRLGQRVYPVSLLRVADPEQLDRVWEARLAKLGEPAGTKRPGDWWAFEAVSR